MGPALPAGSLVLTTRLEPADVQDGDAVAFRPPARHDTDGRPVLHRVARIDQVRGQAVLRKCGDMHVAIDPWSIPLDGADLGCTQASVPQSGRAVVAGPLGVLLLTLGGGCLAAVHRRARSRGPCRCSAWTCRRPAGAPPSPTPGPASWVTCTTLLTARQPLHLRCSPHGWNAWTIQGETDESLGMLMG